MKTLISVTLLSLALLIAACSDGGSGCAADADSATFTLDPNSSTTLVMIGVIDCTTNDKLQAMLNATTVDTLSMSRVEGSVDDVANIAMAKTLSGQSITTAVPNNGLIASGGVDLFLAGSNRTVGSNAIVGVHSWADGSGLQGIALYNSNPSAAEHQLYIDYYDQYVNGLIDGRPSNAITHAATDFYVYTLDAAPAEGLHCMTPQELVDWGVVTNTTDPATLSTLELGESIICTH